MSSSVADPAHLTTHRRRGGLAGGVLLVALALGAYYLAGRNGQLAVPVEKQESPFTNSQEVAIGQKLAPQVVQRFGGLSMNPASQGKIVGVGRFLVLNSSAQTSGWNFVFKLLADTKTVNAFSLPGGQIFLTTALFSQLKTDDQIAAVIAHQMGHVIARHGAEFIAKQGMPQGVAPNADIAAANNLPVETMVPLLDYKYDENQENEADKIAVKYLQQAGYDPQALAEVIQLLVSGQGEEKAGFSATHPSSKSRLQSLQAAIEEARRKTPAK